MKRDRGRSCNFNLEPIRHAGLIWSWYNEGSNHGILGADFWKIRPKQLTDILYESIFQLATKIPEFRRSDITLGYINGNIIWVF